MARKLLIMVALMALVSLIQAPPGGAATYALGGGNELVYAWTEIHGEFSNSYPGDPNGQLTAWFTAEDGSQVWRIPLLANPIQGMIVAKDEYTITLKIDYTMPNDPETPMFSLYGTNLPDITSFDTVVSTIAKYTKDPAADRPNYINGFTLIGGTMSLIASGHDIGGSYFTLSGEMLEKYADHNHYGYFTSLFLTYPATEPASTSAVPIPGAVWLLGTGLLGLGCVGRRRRP